MKVSPQHPTPNLAGNSVDSDEIPEECQTHFIQWAGLNSIHYAY